MATKTYRGRYDEQDIAALDQLAEATGRSRNYHLNEALKTYLTEQRWQIARIQEGQTDLDAGRMTPHEDVMTKGRRIIAEACARHTSKSATT